MSDFPAQMWLATLLARTTLPLKPLTGFQARSHICDHFDSPPRGNMVVDPSCGLHEASSGVIKSPAHAFPLRA